MGANDSFQNKVMKKLYLSCPGFGRNQNKNLTEN